MLGGVRRLSTGRPMMYDRSPKHDYRISTPRKLDKMALKEVTNWRFGQNPARRKLARARRPDGIKEAWEHYGKPMYSRNTYEHMIGFDHWRKWKHPIHDTIHPRQRTRASPIWPRFAEPLPPDPVVDSVPFNELPPPSNNALVVAAVDPVAIARDKAELIHPNAPIAQEDFFQVRSLVKISEMLDHRLHLGHKVGTLHDRMRPFLFGERFGVCIFDLGQTSVHLVKALNFLAHMAYREGVILFCTLNREHQLPVEKLAEEIGEFAHTRRWIQGTFTDSVCKFGATIRLPDVVVVTGLRTPVEEAHPVVHEAAKLSIPVVAITDSDCDPTLITYPIPANDDSRPAIGLLLRLFGEAIRRGKEAREKGTKDFAIPASSDVLDQS